MLKSQAKILNELSVAAFAIDKNHRIISWNKSCEDLTGFTAKEMLGTTDQWKVFYPVKRPTLSDLVLDGTAEEFKFYYDIDMEEQTSSFEIYKSEGWLELANKKVGYFAFEAKAIYSDSGEIVGVFEMLFDLTSHKHLSSKLKLSYDVFDKISDGVIITNEKNEIVFSNKAMEVMSGYSQSELLGKQPGFLGENNQKTNEKMWEHLHKHDMWKGYLVNQHKNGTEYSVNLSITKLKTDNNEVNYVGLLTDITKQRKILEQLNFLAHYDYLTKLPNRRYIEEKITKAIANADKKHTKCAVLFLDLDKFKHINDSLGHGAGDILLKEVAKRLKNVIRSCDIVARQSGDEFVILLDQINSEDEILPIVKKIQKTFEKSFMVKKHKISITNSMGVSVYPNDGKTCSQLLKNADTAMYWSKYTANLNYSFYSNEMNAHIVENINIIDKLNSALNKNLNVYFQPQYCIKTRKFFGAEALIRWYDEDLGWVRPDKFIPLAEEFGIINQIGNFVLKQACEVIQKTNLKISVNLSPIQLADEDLYNNIKKYIEQYNINPNLLTLEITETAFIQNFSQAKEILGNLKTLGISFALDDFGTGYSSLSYLYQLPFDYLKIDQSFLRNKENMSIVNSIIDMAEKLNLMTIAEGVETMEQLIILKYSGCSIIQGYYYSKPLPIDKFIKFVNDGDENLDINQIYDCAVINLEKVGFHNIDNEHRSLIEKIDLIEDYIIRADNNLNLKKEMKQLYEELLDHFINEESAMIENNYPDYLKHKKEHNDVIDKYVLLTQDIFSNKLKTQAVLSFMRRWFVGHILLADKKFIDYCRENNFKY